MTIGVASAMKPQEAREQARKLYGKTMGGGDPLLEKQQAITARTDDTFGQLVTRYLDRQRGRLRPISLWQIERYLTKFASPLHRLPVGMIERKQIANLLDDVERDSGSTSANRARSALSACFSWAMRQGHAVSNPAANTDKRKENERERVLSPAELKRIWSAAPGNHYGIIVKLLMLTGQRFSEIAGLRWSEVDFDKAVIKFPGSRVKNGRAHEIPMSKTVKALLAAQPRNGRETVFSVQSQARCKLALDAAITKANGEPLPDWVHHDLRRTAATGMAELGVQPHIIEAVLNHQSGHKRGVAGIYNHAQYAAQKPEALDRWDRHVTKLVS
jgi:integrase